MCNPASFVINKHYKVFWSKYTDSHSAIIKEHKLTESIGNQSHETMTVLLAKVEVVPPDGDMTKPIKDWIFKDDDDRQPDWYDRKKAEKAARLALKDWHKQKVILVSQDTPISDGEFWVFNATVVAWDNATVKAWGNATVKAWGNATVEAWDNATVEAWGNATVKAWDNATVEAGGNATVEAGGNATVKAWDNATVKAGGNATVEAGDNAVVKAWDNATVKAGGNAVVEAGDNATVKAWDNATVESRHWGNPNVTISANAVHINRLVEPPVVTCGWIIKETK